MNHVHTKGQFRDFYYRLVAAIIIHVQTFLHISGQDAFQSRDLIPRTPAKQEEGWYLMDFQTLSGILQNNRKPCLLLAVCRHIWQTRKRLTTSNNSFRNRSGCPPIV